MADVLSQKEIDALLGALSSGEVSAEEIKQEEETKKVRIYSFKRPSKFSKEQMRTLDMIHEGFARTIGTNLSARTRALTSITIASIDQMTFEEFTRSMANPTILAVFSADTLPSNSIFEVNLKVAYVIVEKLLGGPGSAVKKIRTPTDIEMAIIKREMLTMLDILKDAWVNVIGFIPHLETLETNPQFVQIVPPNEMVILITFNVVISGIEGFMNLCLTSSMLEPVLPKLTASSWFTSGKEELSEMDVKRNKEVLKEISVPVKVEIGSIRLTFSEILSLNVGDVIRLDRKAKSSIDVKIGTKVKFKARPGTVGMKKAIVITEPVEESELIFTSSERRS
ncbi:MAG: flagellar motor switch protein FliM [Thermotoga sp.]|nr:MAG: flagellar motor switch protein FliM [Thermotoga sp.]